MDTKTKLQEAALSLFTEQGVAATTIRQIAQRADIAEGSLYRHYVGKQDLATSLCTDIAAQISQDISSLSADTADLESFVSQLVLYLAGLFDEKPLYFKYIFLMPLNRKAIIENHPESILAARLGTYFQRFDDKPRHADLVSAQVFGAIQNSASYCDTQEKPLSDYCESLILASLRIIKD